MVLLGLVIGFQSGVLSDARLTTPTDFDVSLRQITDFCADVSSSSGVKFSVDKKVQDLKVDVFVDKRPLAETMDKVAKVLNCEWVPIEKGYRLEMDIPTANRERNFVKAENDLRLEDLKLKLWACQYVAKNVPYSNEPGPLRPIFVDPEINQKITKEWNDEALAASQAHDEKRLAEATKHISALYFGFRSYSLGRALLQLDQTAMANLWKGTPFVASTLPGSKIKLYPSDFDRSRQSFTTGPDGKVQEAKYERFTFFRFNPISGNFRMNELSYSFKANSPTRASGTSQSGGAFSSQSYHVPIDPSLTKMPFYVQLQPWMNVAETAKLFSQPIDATIPEWASPWAGQNRRLGEHLRWLHLSTKIPIVAQADRSCIYESLKLNLGSKSVQEYIASLMNTNHCLAKEDKGYLLAKNFRFWSHRQHEVSEAIWKQAEKGEVNTVPTLDQALYIARNFDESNLETEQVAYPLSHLNLSRIAKTLDSFKLYSILTSQQKEQTLQSNGIGLSELGGVQREHMMSTILKLILEKDMCSFELAKALVTNGLDSSAIQTCRFSATFQDRDDSGTTIFTPPNGKAATNGDNSPKPKLQSVWYKYSLSPSEFISQFIILKK